MLTVDEDNRHLGQLETKPDRSVFHFYLEPIALHLHLVEIDSLEHLTAVAHKPGSTVEYLDAQCFTYKDRCAVRHQDPAERPVDIPTGFDETIYPSGMEKVPRRYAIVEANKAMIRQSNYLIAYITHPASNASKYLAYAERLELTGQIKTINIGILSIFI